MFLMSALEWRSKQYALSQCSYISAVRSTRRPGDVVYTGVLTGGQSALERLKVVGMSALKPSSSSSYMKAVLLGKNCSLTLIFGGLKMASNTPLPTLVWKLVSCAIQPAHCNSDKLMLTVRSSVPRGAARTCREKKVYLSPRCFDLLNLLWLIGLALLQLPSDLHT